MKESRFWKKIKAGLLSAANYDIHLVRVENSVCPGTPDLNGCYRGKEFWLELKVGRNKLSAVQHLWANKRIAAGGRVFNLRQRTTYIGLYQGDLLLYSWNPRCMDFTQLLKFLTN